MPVFRSGRGQAPPWCEMTQFELVELGTVSRFSFAREAPREKFIVTRGQCLVTARGTELPAGEGAQFDLGEGDDGLQVRATDSSVSLVRMCGHWGEEVGGSGMFLGIKSDDPQDVGDPVWYPKETNFDRHYHDCDEYWIVLEGSGLALSEGRFHELRPGDCLATGMGHHHDLPKVKGVFRGVFFETTLEGRKRRGHLWEHTHGPAEPCWDRV
jgi:mannose-6-phosphate isomerase-like protein (cupin superfamily)